MKLTVSDVAHILRVSEKTIYRWIKLGKLPAYRIHDHYRFNRSELMEWATAQRISVSPEMLVGPSVDVPTPHRLCDILRTGGIFYRLAGSTKGQVLQSLIEVMNLPDNIDHGMLLEGFLARESLASTGIGHGVAIPHVRGPIVMHVEQPILALGFLEVPIDFDAVDARPVHILFSLICPTIRAHLQTLSHLSYMLQNPRFMELLQRHGLRDDILHMLDTLEPEDQQPTPEQGKP